jgi:histidine ammonia-lyase
MNASQAIEYRRPLQSSEFIEMFLSSYREVPFVKEDRILHYDIENRFFLIVSKLKMNC